MGEKVLARALPLLEESAGLGYPVKAVMAIH
jgi:hypothetical protein